MTIASHVVGIERARRISDARVLAVRYVNEFGDTIGNFGIFTDTLALELIKPWEAVPDDVFGYTWAYMMRYIYDLGLTNIHRDRFDLQIIDDIGLESVPRGASIPWIRVFGLDQAGSGGVGPPDGHVDIGLIDFDRGILTFPNSAPFAPSDSLVEFYTDGLFAFVNNVIYGDIREPEIYTEYPDDRYYLDFSHFLIKVEAVYPE